MATRTFCDQCGNTCRTPNRFVFGPKPPDYSVERDMAYAMAKAQGMVGGLAGVQAMPSVPQVQKAPSKGIFSTKVVDLCDVCVPIWYERVDKLCRASDLEED